MGAKAIGKKLCETTLLKVSNMTLFVKLPDLAALPDLSNAETMPQEKASKSGASQDSSNEQAEKNTDVKSSSQDSQTQELISNDSKQLQELAESDSKETPNKRYRKPLGKLL